MKSISILINKAIIIFLFLMSVNTWAMEKLAQSANGFGFRFYHLLQKQKENNIFFSPFSIFMALSMTSEGAQMDTLQQMLSSLELNQYSESQRLKLFKDVSSLFQQWEKGINPPLLVANSLWGQKNLKFNKSFIEKLLTNYNAPLKLVDFKNNHKKARIEINEWVAMKTNDKIPNLLPQGSLSKLTSLVLTNAVYFNQKWLYAFDKKNTFKENFYNQGKNPVKVKMMHLEENFQYFENDEFQLLELPYVAGDFVLWLALPKGKNGLAKLESKLNHSFVKGVAKKLQKEKVNLSFPQLHLQENLKPIKYLKEMGINDAFSQKKANFKNVTNEVELYISDIFHKATLDIDEEGTEAAAATGIVLERKMALPTEPKHFRANRPFWMGLMHKGSSMFIFMGKVVKMDEQK